jgi:competence protein ComEA
MKLISSMIILSCALISVTVSATTPNSPPTILKTAPKININTATAAELTHLVKGIGRKRAEAIVQYREQHGHFKSIQELAAVHGFGERFITQHASELQGLLTY